ncbi:MAG TPA: hypothetical protein VFU96_09080, partial [Acidimicrobiia bacterium]|nr:hypothetical protein [Acidimicrobiia bacterium]
MRFPDDYMGEMATTKVLDWEIERLLAGTPVAGGRLSGLVPVVEMVRTQWVGRPSESAVQRFAVGASSVLRATRPEASELLKLQRRRVGGRLGLSMR